MGVLQVIPQKPALSALSTPSPISQLLIFSRRTKITWETGKRNKNGYVKEIKNGYVGYRLQAMWAGGCKGYTPLGTPLFWQEGC